MNPTLLSIFHDFLNFFPHAFRGCFPPPPSISAPHIISEFFSPQNFGIFPGAAAGTVSDDICGGTPAEFIRLFLSSMPWVTVIIVIAVGVTDWIRDSGESDGGDE